MEGRIAREGRIRRFARSGTGARTLTLLIGMSLIETGFLVKSVYVAPANMEVEKPLDTAVSVVFLGAKLAAAGVLYTIRRNP